MGRVHTVFGAGTGADIGADMHCLWRQRSMRMDDPTVRCIYALSGSFQKVRFPTIVTMDHTATKLPTRSGHPSASWGKS
jgi:hypothetical protein